MPIQAILLSLVILASILLNGANLSDKNSKAAEMKSASQSETISLAISQNIVAAGEAISENFNYGAIMVNSGINTVNSGINIVNQNIDQNLSSIGQILSQKRDDYLSKLSEKNISSQLSGISESSSRQLTGLISEAKIDLPIFICHLDAEQYNFTSKAILARYLDYNSNIFELNSEKRWPIASLTKLMTSLIALEKIPLDKEVAITEKAVNSEGTAGDFKVGEVFEVNDLIKAMLVVSSNDAAVAVTEVLGEQNYINEMQKKAAELKMFQSSYLEPTGLSFINQSTINDLTKLVSYIYKNYPQLFKITSEKQVTITDLKTGKSRELSNINYFAGQPDFLGGKTGYTDEAGRNLIALFDIDGKMVLTITLGADDSFKETEKLKGLVQNCKAEL